MTETALLLLVYTVAGIAAQSGNNESQYNREVIVIIATSVCITAAVVIFIVCTGCIYHKRALKKIQTKVWMRELIDCKHRHDLISTPDNLVTLDNYLKEQGVEADCVFVDAGEESEERLKTEVTNGHGVDLDALFTTEYKKRQVFSMLHVPDKVKQLYEGEEMEMYETAVEGIYSEVEKQIECTFEQKSQVTIPNIKVHQIYDKIEVNTKEFRKTSLYEKQDDNMFEKKFNVTQGDHKVKQQNRAGKIKGFGKVDVYPETDEKRNGIAAENEINKINGKDNPGIDNKNVLERQIVKENKNISLSQENNVPTTKKVDVLNLSDVDQFFNPTTTFYYRKKKNKKLFSTRRTTGQEMSYLQKHLKPLRSENLEHFKKGGDQYTLKVNRLYSQKGKSKTNIAKDYDDERSKISLEMEQRERSRHSRNSVQEMNQFSNVHLVKKHRQKKSRKGRRAVQPFTSTSRYRNPSRASDLSQKSLTYISVTDIGVNIE